MKKTLTLLIVLAGLVLGLATVVAIQYQANHQLTVQVSDQRAEIENLTAEIRPLRTSEKLMLNLSKENKEWEKVARSVVEDTCSVRYGSEYCKSGALLVDPEALRVALVAYPSIYRR